MNILFKVYSNNSVIVSKYLTFFKKQLKIKTKTFFYVTLGLNHNKITTFQQNRIIDKVVVLRSPHIYKKAKETFISKSIITYFLVKIFNKVVAEPALIFFAKQVFNSVLLGVQKNVYINVYVKKKKKNILV